MRQYTGDTEVRRSPSDQEEVWVHLLILELEMKEKGSSLASLPLFTFSIYTLLSILTLTSNCFLLLSSSTTVIAQKETQASRKLLVPFISEVKEPGLGRWRNWTAIETNWSRVEPRSWNALLSCPELRLVLCISSTPNPFSCRLCLGRRHRRGQGHSLWQRITPRERRNSWRGNWLFVSATNTLSCQQTEWAHQSGAGGRGTWAVCRSCCWSSTQALPLTSEPNHLASLVLFP